MNASSGSSPSSRPTRQSRRVLVTGGASGLGAALVERFLARGDRVLVTDVHHGFTTAPGASYYRLDVTSPADWAAARDHVLQAWGGLDVLVNNAGMASGGRIDVAGADEWRQVLEVNVLSVATGCRTFVPVLKAQAEAGESPGHLLNVASMAGLIHPPGMSAYDASKAAVVALTESLRFELAPWGITATALCPSFFRTNLTSSLNGRDETLNKLAGRMISEARLTADEVADAAIAGIDRRAPLVIPDRAGRTAWLAKRFAGPVYERRMRRMAAYLRERTSEQITS